MHMGVLLGIACQDSPAQICKREPRCAQILAVAVGVRSRREAGTAHLILREKWEPRSIASLDPEAPAPPAPAPGDVYRGRWHQLGPRTRPWPVPYPSPSPAPALPEALKGPDCAGEVSERQQLDEYMKGSFVQVTGAGAGGLRGRRAAWK